MTWKYIYVVVVGAFLLLSVGAPALAQKPFSKGLSDAKTTAGAGGISTATDVIKVISDVILWLLALSAVLAMGALVWGGISYIMSLGDEGRAEKAKKVIMFAVIGIIVIILSYVIIAFVQDLLVLNEPLVPTAYAQTDVKDGFNSGKNVIIKDIAKSGSGLATDTDIVVVIVRIINYMLGMVAVLALAALVWSSIMYILALGDESRAEKAKKIILYAIIGVLVSGLSFLILKVVQTLLTGP